MVSFERHANACQGEFHFRLRQDSRIGTRFEKLAINFLAMMKLAMIQRCLKMAFSDRA